ncbi:hypothetical protein BC830DRAFT_1167540 [Chytriomyces sp. MP71]|nr:hypothetical protein BC830DRAFT_1167540 [Chytriomyces sp. MP71]
MEYTRDQQQFQQMFEVGGLLAENEAETAQNQKFLLIQHQQNMQRYQEQQKATPRDDIAGFMNALSMEYGSENAVSVVPTNECGVPSLGRKILQVIWFTEAWEDALCLLVQDIVNVMGRNHIEAKVVVDKDPITLAPRVRIVFRYVPDAERFFATVNGSAFLGSKVHLTFKDPNMNFSNTSGSKTIVVKKIPLQVTSLELYDAVRQFGRIIFCKVMMDRSGMEAYALLQFEEQGAGEKCVAAMNGFALRGTAF